MGKTSSMMFFIKKVNQKFPLEFAVLFGSRAKDESLKTSDYDILFVSNKFPEDVFKRMSDILELWDIQGSLEPVCYTHREFLRGMKGYNSIVWESLKDGKPLFGAAKFQKYQKLFTEALNNGAIEIRKTIKFNKSPAQIVEAASI